MHLICPLCQTSLEYSSEGGLCCEQQHRFDRAKEGYFNLLPVQHKRSKQPGDSAEMLQARRAFLSAGHYAPLQQKVAETLATLIPPGGTLLDIGCGEGYYSAAARAAIQGDCYGLDVSKTAVRYAAKRYPELTFVVASSHRLPLADNSLEGILRIYAPCKAEEMVRTLKPGGYAVTVTPGPRHLVEFKAMIYPQVKLHDVADEQLAGLQRIDQRALNYTMTLSGKEAVSLLQMTPFAWRAKPEVWQQLAERAQFTCEADFLLTVWQKPQ
ncbi:23S rRNA (guanine(745)-N(1))-methyltransferase [Enterobacterales bacterium CwR94]|nr:23S rRNA (guanine(745)-N(1))-methyltransferase [Enterobacterales bacterium CwR94]